MITLIPKVSHVDNVGDYRPISCGNTVYKVISKIFCNRMKKILPEIISTNQSAFIGGRNIAHNILMSGSG